MSRFIGRRFADSGLPIGYWPLEELTAEVYRAQGLRELVMTTGGVPSAPGDWGYEHTNSATYHPTGEANSIERRQGSELPSPEGEGLKMRLKSPKDLASAQATTPISGTARRPGDRHLDYRCTLESPHPSRYHCSLRSTPVPKGADPRTPCGASDGLEADGANSCPSTPASLGSETTSEARRATDARGLDGHAR